jgi:ssDNA-binding Zn-finger/Zn-ribbon topoisomerase 1
MQVVVDVYSRTNEEVWKSTCSVCKYVCWHKPNSATKGWVVTREDYSDLICPDCNPYLRHSPNPDFHKMKRIEDANIPHRNEI